MCKNNAFLLAIISIWIPFHALKRSHLTFKVEVNQETSFIAKGQLISKWFFGVFDFLKKKNERIRLYYYDTSGRLVSDHFLEEIDDPKKPFRN